MDRAVHKFDIASWRLLLWKLQAMKSIGRRLRTALASLDELTCRTILPMYMANIGESETMSVQMTWDIFLANFKGIRNVIAVYIDPVLKDDDYLEIQTTFNENDLIDSINRVSASIRKCIVDYADIVKLGGPVDQPVEMVTTKLVPRDPFWDDAYFGLNSEYGDVFGQAVRAIRVI